VATGLVVALRSTRNGSRPPLGDELMARPLRAVPAVARAMKVTLINFIRRAGTCARPDQEAGYSGRYRGAGSQLTYDKETRGELHRMPPLRVHSARPRSSRWESLKAEKRNFARPSPRSSTRASSASCEVQVCPNRRHE